MGHRMAGYAVRILMAVATLGSSALAAKPKTLRTGALVPNGPTFCTFVNLGRTPIDVTFTMLNSQGLPVVTETQPVAPGQSGQINASTALDLTRCQFDFVGSPKTVRAAIQLPDGSTSEAR